MKGRFVTEIVIQVISDKQLTLATLEEIQLALDEFLPAKTDKCKLHVSPLEVLH